MSIAPAINLVKIDRYFTQSNMPRRRRTYDAVPISLPVTVEVSLLVVSLAAGELFVGLSMWLILAKRSSQLQDAFGINLNLTSMISNLLLVVFISGLLVGLGIHFKVRRWLDAKVSRLE